MLRSSQFGLYHRIFMPLQILLFINNGDLRQSLPLDRRRRLARDVIHHARDAADFVHDAPRHVVEEIVGEAHPVRGHEVHRFYRAQRDHEVITAAVAHDADRTYRQKHGERLGGAVIEVVPAQFVDVDGIGASQEIGVFLADFTQDAHTESGTREGVAVDHCARQAEFDAEAPHLVLEQLAQRLHQLQVHFCRQTADVVVRLDDVRLAGAGARGFDHVRINRALREELHTAELVRFLLKHVDEHAADYLALGFRVRHSGENAKEARLRIDPDDAHAQVLREGAHDLVAFAKTQQSMIHEHAHQLIANGAVEKGGDHRGIHATREPQEHLALADLGTHAGAGVLDDVADAPQGIAAADLAHKSLQQAR